MKAKKSFEKIRTALNTMFFGSYDKEYEEISKALDALEAICDNDVDMNLFKKTYFDSSDNVEATKNYNRKTNSYFLREEDYENISLWFGEENE